MYFWSYQRYEMIQECVDRPSVAPPFTLLWYCGEIVYAAILRLLSLCPGLKDFEQEIADDPFCEYDPIQWACHVFMVHPSKTEFNEWLKLHSNSSFACSSVPTQGVRLAIGYLIDSLKPLKCEI